MSSSESATARNLKSLGLELGQPVPRDKVLEFFTREWKERIYVLDGAMGTMVQGYKLSESDFRGERFLKHPKDLKGNNDLLCFTRPDVVTEIHQVGAHAGLLRHITKESGACAYLKNNFFFFIFLRRPTLQLALICARPTHSTVRQSPSLITAWSPFAMSSTRPQPPCVARSQMSSPPKSHRGESSPSAAGFENLHWSLRGEVKAR
jgi:hypothetical protein